MSRLYSYKDCHVIVLPQPGRLEYFPGATGAPLLQNGDEVQADGPSHITVTAGLAKGIVMDAHVGASVAAGTTTKIGGLSGQVGERVDLCFGKDPAVHGAWTDNICSWGHVVSPSTLGPSLLPRTFVGTICLVHLG